jgi:hypothetical protein
MVFINMIQLDETLTTTSRNWPPKKTMPGIWSFSFLSWKKKTQLTHREKEKFVWLVVRNPPTHPTRRESILSGKKSWGSYRTTEGVPPAKLFISTNYIAVLKEKGFETTFQAKWVVHWTEGHACWEFLLVGNKYYMHWRAREGRGTQPAAGTGYLIKLARH